MANETRHVDQQSAVCSMEVRASALRLRPLDDDGPVTLGTIGSQLRLCVVPSDGSVCGPLPWIGSVSRQCRAREPKTGKRPRIGTQRSPGFRRGPVTWFGQPGYHG